MEGEVKKTRREMLAEHEEELLALAARMRALSLAPNMGEKVGAAILLRDGTMLGGFNAPHASMCAEGAALLGFDGVGVSNIVAVVVDGGESVCWDHLKELRKGDRDRLSDIL